MKRFYLLHITCTLALSTFAQTPTVGTIFNTQGAYDGYTLFAPLSSNTTYLIDNCGQQVNAWQSDAGPGDSAYLLEDGSLLRTKKLNNPDFSSSEPGK